VTPLATVALALLTALPPAPCGPVPSDRQLARLRLETCGLVHFGVPGPVGRDLANASEDRPVPRFDDFDAGAWVEDLREMALDGVIVVMRDEDGFSLADTPIATAIAGVLTDAKIPFGMSLAGNLEGAELSTDVALLCERFGPLFEIRLGSDDSPGPVDARDVACGEACLAAPDGGDFLTAPIDAACPDAGDRWRGVERALSIRPSWQWRLGEDERLRSVAELEDAWFASVGQGDPLLLGVPVDRDGRFRRRDVERVGSWQRRLASVFREDAARSARIRASSIRGGSAEFDAAKANDGSAATFWATDEETTDAWLELSWDTPVFMNILELREPERLGARCERWSAEAMIEGRWTTVAAGDTIGFRRTVRFETVRADALRVRFVATDCPPALAQISVFAAPPQVRLASEERSFRERTVASLAAAGPPARILYTLDGRDPVAFGANSDGEIPIESSCLLRAVAVDASGRAGYPIAARFIRLDGEPFLEAVADESLGRTALDGLEMDLHDGVVASLDELEARTARSTIILSDVRLPSPRPADRFALVYRGFLRVPEDGLYTFSLRSDDASRMYLHDRLIVDRDGSVIYDVREGRVALRRGLHPLRVEYCEFEGRESLSLWWARGDAEATRVPASAFAR
jgi:hypothetical protein